MTLNGAGKGINEAVEIAKDFPQRKVPVDWVKLSIVSIRLV